MCLLFGNVHGEGEDTDSDDDPPPKLASIPHQNAQGETIGEWVFKAKKGDKSTVVKTASPKLLVSTVPAPQMRIIQSAPTNTQTYQLVQAHHQTNGQLVQAHHQTNGQTIHNVQYVQAPCPPPPAAQTPITIVQSGQTASQLQIPRVYTSAVGGWYLSCHTCPPPSALFTASTRGACAHIGLVNGNGGLIVSEPAPTPTSYYTQYTVGGMYIAVANNNPKEMLLFQDGAWRPCQVPLLMQGQNGTVVDNSGGRIQLLAS
ncbi:hypothetical protein BJ508DRAFT_330220 [Ascobolus immersus RN42]|uniref:Uncharacterized protein n=1 Tax=Ascobolus immersus RN42 TaxID=1160509 RepID=A0A3N4HU78_ASCIM|nr:hypothetical protein BJ508DRAFT_330220 [Ascobolus immersus RN42]